MCRLHTDTRPANGDGVSNPIRVHRVDRFVTIQLKSIDEAALKGRRSARRLPVFLGGHARGNLCGLLDPVALK